MPIYEYVCDRCERTVEVLQSLSDPPPAECPHGDGGKMKRILSAHSVGGVAQGTEGAFCDRSPEPSCGGCGMAGTGCS
jgi:putative FmdB family regulatory protein